MPTTINNIKVFVASPSDVKEERENLKQVIDELNKILGARTGIRLELVGWETDTFPGVGEDAQSVINEQIADDYDVFIGIFWKQFGTKTSRAESGTAEEFSRAYKRACEKPGSVHVMFYFNDSPIPPSEINPHQLSQILEFQSGLEEKGVYYWVYKTTDEFKNLVRSHLARVIDSIGKESKESKVDAKVNSVNPPKPNIIDWYRDEAAQTSFITLRIGIAIYYSSETYLSPNELELRMPFYIEAHYDETYKIFVFDKEKRHVGQVLSPSKDNWLLEFDLFPSLFTALAAVYGDYGLSTPFDLNKPLELKNCNIVDREDRILTIRIPANKDAFEYWKGSFSKKQ